MVTSVTLTGTPSSLLAGDAHTFNCMTSPSQPPACITWYIRTSGYVRELDRDDCNKDSSYTVATSRRLSFTASAADNGAELYCNASNSVTNVPVQSQVYELKVNYTPEITCDQSHVTVFQGQQVNISCKVKANPIARVTWAKNRLNNAFTATRDPTQRDVILSTSKIEITKAMTSGVYEIEATNNAGSSRAEVEFTVIDNQKIPKNLKTISCINNQATLVWPSGINSSLVEYYKLEYKGNGEEWKQELIRNPGRVKLVETTLNDLQSGVLYQFRLQPDSDIALPEYAKAECTMENAGLSTAEMFGVGFAVGFVVLAILVVAVACFLRRRAKKKLALN
ncbi:neural cell adhesion molecule 2-like [Liolophura sinensis]|uniref:neural cell adhesion molecule 2-like n=1 Tax=Liolophura sinensis TaxID=3198878 RepID=UPI003158A7B5